MDYVECDAKGIGGDPQRCFDAGVEAYPTWVLGSSSDTQRHTGALGLQGLEGFLGLPSPPAELVPPARPPPVETPSSAKALAVGRALQERGATLYGAYWCGFCNQDRQALGKEAAAMVTPPPS